MYYTASRGSLQGVFAKKRNNLSVNALHCHCPGCGTQRLLRCRLHPAGRCPNSSSLFPPLAAVVAVAPTEGGFGIPESFASSPEAPLPGELAGASPTERLDEGRPDREALARLNLSVIASQCHLPYRGEALAFRKALPLRQRLPLWGSWLRSA